MFKFMKSKKGFSLVELMIVVVIMAILVAVAVPIFNSVTGNARAKTCIDNQRQIMSTVGNMLMMAGVSDGGDSSFTVSKTGFNMTNYTITATNATATDIQGAFKTVPCCGADDGVILVTIEDGENGAMATASVVCQTYGLADSNPHVLVDTPEADDDDEG